MIGQCLMTFSMPRFYWSFFFVYCRRTAAFFSFSCKSLPTFAVFSKYISYRHEILIVSDPNTTDKQAKWVDHRSIDSTKQSVMLSNLVEFTLLSGFTPLGKDANSLLVVEL